MPYSGQGTNCSHFLQDQTPRGAKAPAGATSASPHLIKIKRGSLRKIDQALHQYIQEHNINTTVVSHLK